MAKKKKNKAQAPKPMSDKRFVLEKARSLPVYKCYVVDKWEEAGLSTVIVARERGSGNLCVAIFLCDIWCLGVKDAYGMANISKGDFQRQIIETLRHIQECDYALAHNIIYGSEEWADEIGIKPHPGFALWKHVLEEDNEDVPFIDIDFGRDGKYFLMAEAGSRDALYIPQLKSKLGDNFDYILRNGDPFMDDYDDDDYDDEFLQNIETMRREDDRHPDEPYSYVRPAYPDTLELKHQFIAEEFSNPDNDLSMPSDVIDRILALPADEAVSDISNLILYTIGQTWEAIDNDDEDLIANQAIIHSLIFLTQFADERGLDAVLELMRQDDEFRDFHLGDSGDLILTNLLYALARNHPERLEEYLMQPGLNVFIKLFASDALVLIASKEPQRRQEIIEIFRRYLNFMQENIPVQHGCSGLMAGFITSDLINLKATELLPEIKQLHDSGYVNLNVCGSYEKVEKAITSSKKRNISHDFTGIRDLYADLRATFRN